MLATLRPYLESAGSSEHQSRLGCDAGRMSSSLLRVHDSQRAIPSDQNTRRHQGVLGGEATESYYTGSAVGPFGGFYYNWRTRRDVLLGCLCSTLGHQAFHHLPSISVILIASVVFTCSAIEHRQIVLYSARLKNSHQGLRRYLRSPATVQADARTPVLNCVVPV